MVIPSPINAYHNALTTMSSLTPQLSAFKPVPTAIIWLAIHSVRSVGLTLAPTAKICLAWR